MVWELEAFNTDSRYQQDIRYRDYTKSKKKAEAFDKIPKIQFTDSGHGIVFSARELKGMKKPRVFTLSDYVREHLKIETEKKTRQFHVHVYKVVGKREYNIDADDDTKAKAGALELSKTESADGDWGEPDCKMIALDVK